MPEVSVLNKSNQSKIYAIELHSTMESAKVSWEKVAPDDILFSPPFLYTIEKCPPEGLRPLYCIVSINETAVGILYFQEKFIRLSENLRFENKGFSPLDIVKKTLSYLINFTCVICGNSLLTGKYGMYFNESINDFQKQQIIEETFAKVNDYLSHKKITPGLSVTKDYFADELPFAEESQSSFIKFSVQPKMMVSIKSSWLTYHDYLNDIKSKYRIRNNKARSLMNGITVREFDYQLIVDHKETIHSLYKQISDNAGFNAFILHKDYFCELKNQLGDKIQFNTYWKDDKMIAFHTAIHNGSMLDAHFLGYDKDENLQHHLYLNMLLDLLNLAIETKKENLDLSRTAMEIKSTIGAKAYDMFLYIRHENKVLHRITKKILDFVKPESEYVLRNPFKE